MTATSVTTAAPVLELAEAAEEIGHLCRQFDVLELDVFGSAAHAPLREDSDIDLVVSFSDSERGLFEGYFALKEALQTLLGRSVDLVTAESIRNPYFRASVDASRVNVYHRSRS